MNTALDPGIKGYTAWRKALWADSELRAEFEANENRGRVDLRVVAEIIAMQGANGRGCFAGSETIARQIGCCRKTVERHRTRLIHLGWLTVVGRKGRAIVLSISIPLSPEPTEDDTPYPADLFDGPELPAPAVETQQAIPTWDDGLKSCPRHGAYAKSFRACPDCELSQWDT